MRRAAGGTPAGGGGGGVGRSLSEGKGIRQAVGLQGCLGLALHTAPPAGDVRARGA